MAGFLSFVETPAKADYYTNNAAAATQAQLDSTSQLFAATTDGAMLRVIDGVLWVWGNNNGTTGDSYYGLGLRWEADGLTDATNTTVVTSPMKHDYYTYKHTNAANEEVYGFEGKIIKVMTSTNNGVTVLTNTGHLYSWGKIWNHYVGGPWAADGGKTPKEWDLSNVTGTVVDVYSSSLAISIKDSDGKWYIAGCDESMLNFGYPAVKTSVFQPVTETNIDQMQPSYNPNATLTDTQQAEVDAGTKTATYYKVTTTNQREGQSGRWTIDKVIPSYGGNSCFVVVKSPDGKQKKLFSKGFNNHAQNLRPDVYDGTTWLGYGGYSVDIVTTDANEQKRGHYPWLTGHQCDWVNVWEDPANSDLIDNGASIDTLQTDGKNTSFIDADGSVWLVGDDKASLYPAGTDHRRPQKVYDALENGSRCVKVFQSTYCVCFLTEDNALYAIGKNANQFMSTAIGNNVAVTDYTQIFTELSESRTITGVYVTSKGVMVVTKSGELYYAGDNSTGAAGNGTKESEPAGTAPKETIQSTVPVLEPSTENKVLFEIVATKDNVEHSFMYDEDAEAYVDTWYDGATKHTDELPALELEVGSTFTLHAYFKDFGKINEWVMPIRFDSKYVQVCNGGGETYATDRIVSPGAIGESVGITKEFTTLDWSEGVLVGEPGTGGQYPKICNGGGWVSVMGHTDDKKANINGTVEMFSIKFKVLDYGNTPIRFDAATKSNGPTGASVITYDVSGINVGDFNYGPGYLISPSDVTLDASAFSFDFAGGWPAVKPYITPMKDMELILTRANGTQITDQDNWKDTVSPSTDTAHYQETGTALALSAENTSELYYVKVNPDPGNSSYPQVTWTKNEETGKPYTVRVVNPGEATTDSEGSGGTEDAGVEEDYICNVTEKDTYISFNITDGKVPSGAQILITFEATNKTYSDAMVEQEGSPKGYVTRTLTFVIEKFEAPKSIKIVEGNDTHNSGNPYVYYSVTNAENVRNTFHVYFPGTTDNNKVLGVIWKVLDENHNDITGTSGAAIGITKTEAARGNSSTGGYSGYDPNASDTTEAQDGCTYYRPYAQISPLHTTSGNSVVYLRVESQYNSNVYDEVKIQVHLSITDISFKQSAVHIPMDSSVNIQNMLKISPEDYWADDVTFVYTPTNWSENGVEENVFQWYLPNVYALNTGDGSGKTNGQYHYATVSVTAKWGTNKSKTVATPLNVAAIKLTSPIMPKDIEATNVVGKNGDYVVVHGVEEGDVFEFSMYFPAKWGQTVRDESNNEIKHTITFGALNAAKISTDDAGQYFKFTVSGLMDGKGGTMCLRVTRNLDAVDDATVIQEYKNAGDTNLNEIDTGTTDDEGNKIYTYSYTYDDVPFDYDPEPSKVFGYIKLFGKDDSTKSNAGIRVQLVGMSNPDPVYTSDTGYFEFESYIIPGNYTLIASKSSYLTRYIEADSAAGYVGVTIPEAEKFSISSSTDPIYLYPGDLDNNGTINSTDVNRYLREWVGISNTETPTANFADYDFYDDADKVIGLFDLDVISRFSGFNKDNYAKWYTPSVS